MTVNSKSLIILTEGRKQETKKERRRREEEEEWGRRRKRRKGTETEKRKKEKKSNTHTHTHTHTVTPATNEEIHTPLAMHEGAPHPVTPPTMHLHENLAQKPHTKIPFGLMDAADAPPPAPHTSMLRCCSRGCRKRY